MDGQKNLAMKFGKALVKFCDDFCPPADGEKAEQALLELQEKLTFLLPVEEDVTGSSFSQFCGDDPFCQL